VSIPYEVAAELGFYVYALRDPRDRQVFYVGKGVGGRVYAHQREADDSAEVQTAKRARISDIRRSGHAVEHLLVRTGIADESTAYIVEQAVIDAYAATGVSLANLVKGHHAATHGLSTVEAAVARLASSPTPPIDAPVLMFKINRAWSPDANERDVYEATRGHWKIGWDSRSRARFALGVAFGVVRGAYEIEEWFESEQPEDVGRWGFVGRPAPEIAHVIGTNIRGIDLDGSQNPYRKFLDGFPGVDLPPSTADSPDPPTTPGDDS
jgi:uncharacterized protein